MEYDLTRVHETNLKILKEIDRICRKYKIQYMLDGGTLPVSYTHLDVYKRQDAEHIVGELMKGFIKSRRLPEELRRRMEEIGGEQGRKLAEGLQLSLIHI